MKLQFDPNQPFQRDAVEAVVDLFDGQPLGPPEFSVIKLREDSGLFAGQEQTELGLGNRLLLAEDRLRENLRTVQARNDIEIADPTAEPEGWELFDPTANVERRCPHFSVEMETGTGKTYVYLRTIFELNQKYGFRKFIIVVPSVAIREGVLKNITITADHFRALYDNVAFEHFVYDAKRVNRLRQFATGNTLQLLIINIDAFRKNFTGTDEVRKSNVIYKMMNQLNDRAPIEFVHAARPIVIIDEPQSVDSTPKAQEAIKALNPLCTLRYSATHLDRYNLVYRLDPVRAFELRLVKQIVVASAAAEGSANAAYVKLVEVDYRNGIKAKLRIHEEAMGGPKEKPVTVKLGGDLHTLSKERAAYQEGFKVAEIHAEPGAEFVRFSNGTTLRLGEEIGGAQQDVWRIQIRETVRQHLEREYQLLGKGIKVLSLFFIDRVANYRDYDAEEKPTPGKFAVAFEEALAALAKEPRYAELPIMKLVVGQLHDGYFSQDRKGVLKDTRGNTQDDDDTYNLIMKDKERLLSLEEPLRFIFSHSALREGWDNPNVFQICTLNESRSNVKKRQEIGRGLRLPVNQAGERVFDETINRLYVMANESYEDFARGLQEEYEEDCGVTFGKVPLTALARITRVEGEKEVAIGSPVAEKVKAALVAAGMLGADGRIQPKFAPAEPGFALGLPAPLADLTPAVIDLLNGYRIERHIRKERDEKVNRFKKEVTLTPEFQGLWERIKPRTTYRVEFATESLVGKAVEQIRKMPKVEAPSIRIVMGKLEVKKGGVDTAQVSVAEEKLKYSGGVPDILAYLQNRTELTRSTLVRILKESGRLAEVFVNPQRFMDQVAGILDATLHELLVDGIKYERVPPGSPDAEWEMLLFKDEEVVNYLNALAVNHSVYEYVEYDSEVEREFAKKLDQREDIKLFVKLPRWFTVDTPLGEYNPDWAILKHDAATLYLVRETKGTRDFLRLRTTEAGKVRCGERHFEAIGVDFKVVVKAEDVA